MRFTWDPRKRRSNLKTHHIDFVDAEKIFAGPTHYSYRERDEIRVISFRKATPNETAILFENI
jgi:uncharacterized DUF497 family protein